MQRMTNTTTASRRFSAGVLGVLVSGMLLGAAGQSKAQEVIYGLTSTNGLITFNSTSPTTIVTSNTITGVASGEALVDIDFSPITGQLYALGNLGSIYTLTATGVAMKLSTLNNGNGTTTFTGLDGSDFGIDFNPTSGALRIVSDNGQNLAVAVATGVATVQGSLAFAAGDPNAAASANILDAAYTNNFSGATSTMLFDIDTTLNSLVSQVPTTGVLSTVGNNGLGLDVTDLSGFDISGTTGTAFASFQTKGGFSRLFTVNLGTGAATLVGNIDTNQRLRGIAVVAAPEPGGVATLALGALAVGGLMLRRRKGVALSA